MNESDKPKFAAILNATFSMNPRWTMPDEMGIEMWWRCLKRFSIEQVANGFEAHLTDPERGSFQPTPADVIRHIEGGNKDTREARAELAWRRVLDAVGSVGTYQTVVFDDPAIHYAIQIAFGSWEAVGLMTEDEQPFRRRDFVKAYMAYKPGLPYPPRLAGRFEREQAVADARFRVVAIGDPGKCKVVEAGGTSGGLASLGHEVQALAALGGAA
ncbi:MAG: hypothetical protein D6775_16150 [Caldilineae bacterium]|nr:MAG: hypothetical protein D6775_16150 [Caldilineae bacterium]